MVSSISDGFVNMNIGRNEYNEIECVRKYTLLAKMITDLCSHQSQIPVRMLQKHRREKALPHLTSITVLLSPE